MSKNIIRIEQNGHVYRAIQEVIEALRGQMYNKFGFRL